MPLLPGGIPGFAITPHINTSCSMLVGSAIQSVYTNFVAGMRALSEGKETPVGNTG